MGYTDQTTPWFQINSLGYGKMRTYDDYYSVHTVFEYDVRTQGLACTINYKLELQRYDGGWKTIETKNGSARDNSWAGNKQRGYVSFNNIGQYKKRMRVRITAGGKVFHSGAWVR